MSFPYLSPLLKTKWDIKDIRREIKDTHNEINNYKITKIFLRQNKTEKHNIS